MTLQEYRDKLTRIEEKYQHDQKAAAREYALSNNPYNMGDKVTDHIGTIVIEKINAYTANTPCCIYYGTELKKDGTPKLSGAKRSVYQSNIESI